MGDSVVYQACNMRVLILILVVSMAMAHPDYSDSWEEFKGKYGKEYSDADEEGYRQGVWKQNVDFISSHNEEHEAGLHDFSVGENEFADMTHDEITSYFNGLAMEDSSPSGQTFYSDVSLDSLPTDMDWRKNGSVTPVKNQGHCGSCWAFSATGSLEGQHYKKTGHLVSLSEQQLVDCSTANYGCQGGWVYKAFDYIKTHHGIASESAYPYKGVKGHCHFHTNDAVATLTGWVHVRGGSETDLQAAVSQKGPISVAIDASHRGFQMYKHGVYHDSNCSPRNLNHAVLVVGYGQETGGKYWLVKNSWGRSWGNQGYINMAKDRHNHCGIASQAYYPTV